MQRYIFTLFVSAVAAGKCYAPTMPGIDGCSECEASELNGGQCVRSGRWFSCSADLETCCKNGEVANHVSFDTCVGKSGGDDPNICQKVVSKVATLNNDYCADQCGKVVSAGGDVKTDPAFNQICMYQHYESINGRTKVDDTCFEKWVYGYSEPNVNASYKQGLLADTPAQCQLLCQKDPECVNWIWASDLYNESGGQDVKHRCDLKNKQMIDKAASIKFTDIHPPGLDTQFCNYGMPYQCLQGGFRCLPCGSDDIPSCIWESDMHVTGWRHCVPTPLCGQETTTLAPPPAPTTPAPTTPAPTTPAPTTPAPTTPAPTTPAPTTQAPTTPAPTTQAPTTPAPATPAPTQAPTPAPTPAPTEAPSTPAPTPAPTEAPSTPAPTEAPSTPAPTPAPTEAPSTPAPTPAPTEAPSTPAPAPTEAPSTPAPAPTEAPAPTQGPTEPAPTPAPVTEASITDIVLSTTEKPDEESSTTGGGECETTKTSGDDGECSTKPHPCGEPCDCRGKRCSPCCRQHAGIEIRVMDRPKHLAFEIDN